MKEINAYLVPKFSPEDCPRCFYRFKGPEDFRPVLIKSKSESGKVERILDTSKPVPWDSLGLIQFLSCQHCNNITMIVNLDQRYVFTIEEANKLVNEGYTAILPVMIKEITTEVRGQLSFWFRVTYDRLSNQAATLRNTLNTLEDHEQRASSFEQGMSMILRDLVREFKKEYDQENVFCRARNILKSNWEQLTNESKELILAAEYIKNDLKVYAKTEIDIDFTAPVLLYSQVLENELYQRIFKPFAAVCNEFNYEYQVDNAMLKSSIRILNLLCKKGRKPTLGEMAYCLQSLTGHRGPGNWFRTFVRSQVRDYEYLFIEHVFPQRMIGYVNAYRNRCGLESAFTGRECDRCEEYLFNEPIKLLPMLVEEARIPVH